MIVVVGEYPKDCLHCFYRHCLHIGGKYYQMCGLNGDGYLLNHGLNQKIW